MAILARFTKQSTETLDYYVDYSEWFADRSDSPQSFTSTVEAGITLAQSSLAGNVVRVVLAGGTNGVKYKTTVRLTTSSTPPIIKEADFVVAVRES